MFLRILTWLTFILKCGTAQIKRINGRWLQKNEDFCQKYYDSDIETISRVASRVRSKIDVRKFTRLIKSKNTKKIIDTDTRVSSSVCKNENENTCLINYYWRGRNSDPKLRTRGRNSLELDTTRTKYRSFFDANANAPKRTIHGELLKDKKYLHIRQPGSSIKEWKHKNYVR